MIVVAAKFKVAPEQIGPLLDATGGDVTFTTTVTVPAEVLVHPFDDTVTE